MRYDHHNYGHRFLLAGQITSKLEDHEFSELDNEMSGEIIMKRLSADKRYLIKVFTTVEKKTNMTRGVGRDAIRVVLLSLAKDGKEIPVSKAIRVFRVGDMDNIANRITDAVRTLALSSKTLKLRTCSKCDAKMFLSKKNNWVCSKFCYKM